MSVVRVHVGEHLVQSPASAGLFALKDLDIRAAVLLISGVALLSCSKRECRYPDGECRAGQVCGFEEKNVSRCVPFDELTTPLAPPLSSGTEFWCSQGGRSSAGRTH